MPEQCGNGVDDDLDGLSDADDEYGPCALDSQPASGCRDGVRRCQNNMLVCVARTQVTNEICANGVDDDCNGTIDDGASCMASFSAVTDAAPMLLGSDNPNYGSGGDAPAHPVCLAAFDLDRTEVSVDAYARWLNSLSATRITVRTYEPENPFIPPGRYILVDEHPVIQLPDSPDGMTLEQSAARGWVPRDGRFAQHPITRVTWEGADAYCRWANKHLPSEAEWWRAVHGPTGTRPYPWGTETADCTRANVGGLGPGGAACVCDLNQSVDPMAPAGSDCSGGPLAITSLPMGNTPEGVQNLYGNANEWLHDFLDLNEEHVNIYYRSVGANEWCTRFPMGPLGPAQGTPITRNDQEFECVRCRQARGRHFYRTADTRVGTRRWLDGDVTDATLGFRCATGGATR